MTKIREEHRSPVCFSEEEECVSRIPPPLTLSDLSLASSRSSSSSGGGENKFRVMNSIRKRFKGEKRDGEGIRLRRRRRGSAGSTKSGKGDGAGSSSVAGSTSSGGNDIAVGSSVATDEDEFERGGGEGIEVVRSLSPSIDETMAENHGSKSNKGIGSVGHDNDEGFDARRLSAGSNFSLVLSDIQPLGSNSEDMEGSEKNVNIENGLSAAESEAEETDKRPTPVVPTASLPPQRKGDPNEKGSKIPPDGDGKKGTDTKGSTESSPVEDPSRNKPARHFPSPVISKSVASVSPTEVLKNDNIPEPPQIPTADSGEGVYNSYSHEPRRSRSYFLKHLSSRAFDAPPHSRASSRSSSPGIYGMNTALAEVKNAAMDEVANMSAPCLGLSEEDRKMLVKEEGEKKGIGCRNEKVIEESDEESDEEDARLATLAAESFSTLVASNVSRALSPPRRERNNTRTSDHILHLSPVADTPESPPKYKIHSPSSRETPKQKTRRGLLNQQQTSPTRETRRSQERSTRSPLSEETKQRLRKGLLAVAKAKKEEQDDLEYTFHTHNYSTRPRSKSPTRRSPKSQHTPQGNGPPPMRVVALLEGKEDSSHSILSADDGEIPALPESSNSAPAPPPPPPPPLHKEKSASSNSAAGWGGSEKSHVKKNKLGKMVRRVMFRANSEPAVARSLGLVGTGNQLKSSQTKGIEIRNRDDARAAAVLSRWSSSFGVKASAPLKEEDEDGGGGGSDDVGEGSSTGGAAASLSPLREDANLSVETGSLATDSSGGGGNSKLRNRKGRKSSSLDPNSPALDRFRRAAASLALAAERPTLLHSGGSDTSLTKRGNRPSYSSIRRKSLPDYAGFTGLRKLCNAPMLDGRLDPAWDRVRRYMSTLSSEDAKIQAETREGDGGETALHLACRQKPPEDVVRLLLKASQMPASWPLGQTGWLPLHILVYFERHSGVNVGVLTALIEANGDAVRALDRMGRTPLHLVAADGMEVAVTPPSFSAMQKLVTVDVVNTRSLDIGIPATNESVGSGTTADTQHPTSTSIGRGVYPLTIQYLADRADKVLPEHASERVRAKEVLGIFLDAKLDALRRPGHRETSDFVSTLEGSPDWFQQHAIVHPYVQAILNWQICLNFPTVVLMLDLYILILLIISFRTAAHMSLDARVKASFSRGEMFVLSSREGKLLMEGEDESLFSNAFGANRIFDDVDMSDIEGDVEKAVGLCMPVLIVYFGVYYLLLREVLQMISLLTRGLFESWVFDIWNYLDVTCIFVVFTSAHRMHHGTGEDDELRLLVVFSSGVLWMMMLSFLKLTKREYAVFVSGVLHVTMTLRSFLVTLSIFLVAFAQMYFTDFQGTKDCIQSLLTAEEKFINSDFCSFRGSFLKVYTMLVGGNVEEKEFTFDNTSLWLSVIFSFLVVLLLLNVLIAIVTDSYQEVKNQGEAVFWSHRLSFVFEVDQIGDLFVDYLINPVDRLLRRNKHVIDSNSRRRMSGSTYRYISKSAYNDLREDDNDSLINGAGASGGASSNAGGSGDGPSSGGGGVSGHPYDHKAERDAFTGFVRTLWDISMIAYEDPSSYGIWKKKVELRKRWQGPKWLLGKLVNPLVSPDDAIPDHKLRLAIAFFLPLWMVGGVISAGLIWPPQVRKWLLCPSISDNSGGSQPADKGTIQAMHDEVKEEVKRIERRVELKLDNVKVQMDGMKENVDSVRESIDNMRDSMDDIKDALSSVLAMVTAVSEMESIKAQRQMGQMGLEEIPSREEENNDDADDNLEGDDIEQDPCDEKEDDEEENDGDDDDDDEEDEEEDHYSLVANSVGRGVQDDHDEEPAVEERPRERSALLMKRRSNVLVSDIKLFINGEE